MAARGGPFKWPAWGGCEGELSPRLISEPSAVREPVKGWEALGNEKQIGEWSSLLLLAHPPPITVLTTLYIYMIVERINTNHPFSTALHARYIQVMKT